MVQKAGLLEMAKLYLGGADPRSPLAAPIYADLKGLAPLLIQVGAAETLLDDAIRLAKVAGAADVRVDLQVWPEMVHVWHLFHPELESRHAGDRSRRSLCPRHDGGVTNPLYSPSGSPRNAASKARAAAVGVRVPAMTCSSTLSEAAGDGGGGAEMLEEAVADLGPQRGARLLGAAARPCARLFESGTEARDVVPYLLDAGPFERRDRAYRDLPLRQQAAAAAVPHSHNRRPNAALPQRARRPPC